MQLFLIRHSLTQGNLEKRYLGCRTDSYLCKEGIALAEATKGQIPTPQLLFASPMARCIETAGILFPEQKPILIPAFRECDFGLFENKNYRELSQNSLYQQWIDSGGTLPFPEGESREAFLQRTCQGFSELLHQYAFSTAAIVAHGGTFMAILSQWELSGKGYFEWNLPHCKPISCRVVEIDPIRLLVEG